jgi:hypothetical protein
LKSKTKLFFIICSLLFIAFIQGDNKSEYIIPRSIWSVYADDINLDGDNDIIVGHRTMWQDTNPTITIMENNNYGVFEIKDTSKVFCGYQQNIFSIDLNNNEYPDIVAFYSDFSTGIAQRYIRIYYNDNGEFPDYVNFTLNSSSIFSYINHGDINGDGLTDLVVTAAGDHFWGVLYNYGPGYFSAPIYHYVTGYFPQRLTCGDLNGDGRDDVVIIGQSTEVYFSIPGGFQCLILEQNSWKSDVAIADFDNDGDNDIITVAGVIIVNVTSVIMYENKGNNVFDTIPEFWFQPMAYKFSVIDFNNDTLPDILFQLDNNSGHVIYYNKGNFQLADSQLVIIEGNNDIHRNIFCDDMDNNGYNDIITIRSESVLSPSILDIRFNDGNGNFVPNPVVSVEEQERHETLTFRSYPNPFHEEITFEIHAKEKDQIEISIYDLNGRLISCFPKKVVTDRMNKLKWQGLDHTGKIAHPGIFIVVLKVNGVIQRSIKTVKF